MYLKWINFRADYSADCVIFCEIGPHEIIFKYILCKFVQITVKHPVKREKPEN